MEEQTDSTQFVPGSLTYLRRTSTGSLTSLKRTTHSSECSSTPNYQSPNSQLRHTPITGGSWDDNSVGHGSVAARMRRERNRVVRQTKSNTSHINNATDTHANITNTLNLINTTALSPWKPCHELFWDEDYSLPNQYNDPSAASRRSAGSLCNIHSSGTLHPWDSRSIPDYSRARSTNRSSYRHSFTSGQHHSNPTSGCASIVGSEIDSIDQAFFSMTDDSSLFDAESLFSDTYGVMDGGNEFSTNIFSLLEEGTISCRTPFLNGDWPDSISELDFDCSEQQNDISNCDAHSDIGPSCSIPTERNRLKKRQSRPHAEELSHPQVSPLVISSEVDPSLFLNVEKKSGSSDEPASMIVTPSAEDFIVDVGGTPPRRFSVSNVDADPDVAPPKKTVFPEAMLVSNQSSREFNHESLQNIQTKSTLERFTVATDDVRDDEVEDMDNETVVNCDVAGKDFDQMTLASNISDWNNMPTDKKLGFVEQLSKRISKTMGLQEQLEIIHIIGAKDKSSTPFQMSIDDIDSHKLSRVLGYLDTHRTVDSPTKLASDQTNPESNLRRSNSDGNLAKSVTEAQKEHRRRQRQARRLAKSIKLRLRKENRQLMKEQRSGLFVNEKKLTIQAESEEEIEIDV